MDDRSIFARSVKNTINYLSDLFQVRKINEVRGIVFNDRVSQAITVYEIQMDKDVQDKAKRALYDTEFQQQANDLIEQADLTKIEELYVLLTIWRDCYERLTIKAAMNNNNEEIENFSKVIQEKSEQIVQVLEKIVKILSINDKVKKLPQKSSLKEKIGIFFSKKEKPIVSEDKSLLKKDKVFSNAIASDSSTQNTLDYYQGLLEKNKLKAKTFSKKI